MTRYGKAFRVSLILPLLKTVAPANSLRGLAQQKKRQAARSGAREEDVHYEASYADATSVACQATDASPRTQGGNASLFDGCKSGGHRRESSYADATIAAGR